MSNLSEVKSYFRDIKMSILLSDRFNFKVDDTNLNDSFNFLRKNKAVIKYTNELGAILTGSRALSSYSVNGGKILERKPRDWDFLITKKMAFDICDKFNIEYNLTDKVINIDTQIVQFYPSYSDIPNRYFVQDVQLIIVNELPSFVKGEKYKIAELSYILEEKIKGVEYHKNKYSKSKHLSDLNKIIVKLENQ